jgi:hypothetical protein
VTRLIIRLLPALLLTFPLAAVPLRVIPWDHGIASRKLAVGWGEKNMAGIEGMHPSARSSPIKLPAKVGQLRLVDLEKAGDDGKPLALPFTVPATVRQALVLLLPDRESHLGLRTLVTEDDPASFRWGSFRFLNATGKDLVFTCDKKPVPLAASLTPRSYSPARGSEHLVVKLFLREQPAKPLYSSIWEHADTLRQFVIIVPRKGLAKDGPVDFKFIAQDSRDLEPPPG